MINAQFGDVEQFLTELRTVGDATAAPAPNAALVEILEGGRVPRASAAPRADVARRRWLRPVVMPATIATVLFGGLAAAGALPAPVQHATARFAAHLGVTLPGHAT